MASECTKNEITFWEFIGLVSLLVAVFGSYFAETNRIAVFYVLFAGIFIFSGYGIYLKNKDIFEKIKSIKTGKKNPYIVQIIPFIIEFMFVASVGVFIFYLMEVTITLPKNDFSIIIALFFSGLWVLFKSRNKDYYRDEPYKYNVSILATLIFMYAILGIFSLFLSSDNIILHSLSYLSVFKNTLHFFLLMSIFELIFKGKYNYFIYKNFDLKANIEFNLKKSIKLFVSIFIVFAMLVFLIFIPQLDKPDNILETQCTIIKTYELNENNNFFGVYKRSINMKDVSDIRFMLEGVLKKDGEYLSIDLTNESLDKYYLQYFDKQIVGDQSFNYALVMFRDKNIAYLNSLKVVTTQRRC